MGVLTHLETDTGTNVDIHAATAVGSYTATGDKLVIVDVSIDAVAGNGDYIMYVTRQIGGSGSSYIILPKTTMAAASGETAISAQSGWITVRSGDVLTCYVDGLAGDTSTPDYTTRWYEAAVQLVTLADDAITAAKFDESTAYPLKAADTGSTQIARVGADSDTLKTLSDQLDVVQGKTDQMTFTVPGKIDASATVDPTGIATSAQLEAVDDKVDAIKAKTDMMDASAISYVTAIEGTTITVLRGDTFSAAISGLGALTGYVSIDFTVKSDKLNTDDEAVIRIRKSASGIGDGLLRLNGAAPTTETGSIAIDDESAGDIVIILDETATSALSAGSYSYDVQLITTDAVKTLTFGKLVVTSDVTRAIV